MPAAEQVSEPVRSARSVMASALLARLGEPGDLTAHVFLGNVELAAVGAERTRRRVPADRIATELPACLWSHHQGIGLDLARAELAQIGLHICLAMVGMSGVIEALAG